MEVKQKGWELRLNYDIDAWITPIFSYYVVLINSFNPSKLLRVSPPRNQTPTHIQDIFTLYWSLFDSNIIQGPFKGHSRPSQPVRSCSYPNYNPCHQFVWLMTVALPDMVACYNSISSPIHFHDRCIQTTLQGFDTLPQGAMSAHIALVLFSLRCKFTTPEHAWAWFVKIQRVGFLP